MRDTLTQIDQKILQLKQKKEKLETKQAATFLKEAQKLFGVNEFSIELALAILSQSWKDSTDKQKEEWHKSASNFLKSSQRARNAALKGAKAHS